MKSYSAIKPYTQAVRLSLVFGISFRTEVIAPWPARRHSLPRVLDANAAKTGSTQFFVNRLWWRWSLGEWQRYSYAVKCLHTARAVLKHDRWNQFWRCGGKILLEFTKAASYWRNDINYNILPSMNISMQCSWWEHVCHSNAQKLG